MRGVNRFGFALLVLAVAGTAPLRADDGHSYMLVNAGTERADFADEHAQRRPDGSVTLSVLTVFAAGQAAYSVNQISINCSSAKIATLTSVTYSAAGVEVPHEALDSSAQPITPGTLGQSLQMFICNGADLYPRSKVINDTANAVAKGRDLIAAARK
jgi:hypothetical protein